MGASALPQTVGIIGLGLMGQSVAGRLIGAGYRVCGYDLKAEARARAATQGVDAVPDARDVASRASVILLCLFSSDDRRRLLWGDQALAESLRRRSLLLDISTGRPADLVEDHWCLLPLGVRLVDTCISGSSERVAEGQAVALIGDREDSAPYAGVLAAFCKAQFYLGNPGAGCTAKLVVNTAMGLNRLVVAETLSLAVRLGLDPTKTLDILRAGDAHSRAMDTKAPRMAERDYLPAAARLSQHAKDVDLILELAGQVGAPMPLSNVHQFLLSQLSVRGLGDFDNAAIYEAFAPETDDAGGAGRTNTGGSPQPRGNPP